MKAYFKRLDLGSNSILSVHLSPLQAQISQGGRTEDKSTVPIATQPESMVQNISEHSAGVELCGWPEKATTHTDSTTKAAFPCDCSPAASLGKRGRTESLGTGSQPYCLGRGLASASLCSGGPEASLNLLLIVNSTSLAINSP